MPTCSLGWGIQKMASDLKPDLVMTAFQSRPTVHLMGNPAVGPQSSESVDWGPLTLNRPEGVLGVHFVTQL